MATGEAVNARTPLDEPLLFRLDKKQLPVRAPEPVVALLDPLRHRAGDCGCGEVGRDELVSALLVAAARTSDTELRCAVEAYRLTRASELGDSGRAVANSPDLSVAPAPRA
jgi:hypothetical protein